MRYLKNHLLLSCAICMMSNIAFAQDIPQDSGVATEQNQQTAVTDAAPPSKNGKETQQQQQTQENAGQTPGTASNGQPQPRRAPRVILNREFDARDKIMLLLNAHCDFPSKEDLLSTSPDAEKQLRDILNDESVLFSVRMRAVEALAYFDTPQNIDTVETILNNPEKHEPLMLMQAIRAYPKMTPDRAPAALAPYLAHDNDFIRFVTITSLRNCPGNAALSVLQSRYNIEKNRFFQSRLKQAIDNHCKQKTYCQ